MKQVFWLMCVFMFLAACGVKGDPLPPEDPPYIGRGKPSFKKAAERFDIRTEDIADESENNDEEEDEEE